MPDIVNLFRYFSSSHLYRLPFTLASLYPFALLSILSSCNNEFEVIDEWKDQAVVYGVLDQNEPTNYVRIQKAFLGKEDAYVMAQNSDSIYYGPDEICDNCVKLFKVDNGSVTDTITMIATTAILKDEGIFSSGYHRIFKTDAVLDPAFTYNLEIENKQNGKVIMSSSPLIGPFPVVQPTTGGSINFYNQGKYQSKTVEWETAKNGRIYQLTIRIKYEEDYPPYGSWGPTLTLDWAFPSLTSTNLDGGEKMVIDANGEEFYKYLAAKIPASDTVNRKFIAIDFIIFVAGDELATYYSINQPSLGIVQEKPDYSNIINNKGEFEMGIFSCRTTNGVFNKKLTFEACNELKNGQYTSKLRFVDPPDCSQ